MHSVIKKIAIFMMLAACIFMLASCTQADNVRNNLKREADDFNVRRRITVLNTRTDTPMMQITGLISISTDDDGDLNITIEKAPNEYVLNYAHLSQDTTYIVEQIETKEVNKYQYEIKFYPTQLISGWFDIQLKDD
jgi:hypothetical protein